MSLESGTQSAPADYTFGAFRAEAGLDAPQTETAGAAGGSAENDVPSDDWKAVAFGLVINEHVRLWDGANERFALITTDSELPVLQRLGMALPAEEFFDNALIGDLGFVSPDGSRLLVLVQEFNADGEEEFGGILAELGEPTFPNASIDESGLSPWAFGPDDDEDVDDDDLDDDDDFDSDLDDDDDDDEFQSEDAEHVFLQWIGGHPLAGDVVVDVPVDDESFEWAEVLAAVAEGGGDQWSIGTFAAVWTDSDLDDEDEDDDADDEDADDEGAA